MRPGSRHFGAGLAHIRPLLPQHGRRPADARQGRQYLRLWRAHAPVFDQPSPHRRAGAAADAVHSRIDRSADRGKLERRLRSLGDRPAILRLPARAAGYLLRLRLLGQWRGTSRMGGELLASLALGMDNAWTRSPLCGGPVESSRPSRSATSARSWCATRSGAKRRRRTAAAGLCLSMLGCRGLPPLPARRTRALGVENHLMNIHRLGPTTQSPTGI